MGGERNSALITNTLEVFSDLFMHEEKNVMVDLKIKMKMIKTKKQIKYWKK